MKINYGCGRQVLDGFFNIDAVRNKKAVRDPELLFTARFDERGSLKAQTPLPDGGADELHAMHVIEHVFFWEAPALVTEWKRLLKPRGLLILELPDLEQACRNLMAGMDDQMAMWPLYGDWNHKDPYMMHKHGYTSKTITALLSNCGFEQIVMRNPKTHGARLTRDMRVEAVKP